SASQPAGALSEPQPHSDAKTISILDHDAVTHPNAVAKLPCAEPAGSNIPRPIGPYSFHPGADPIGLRLAPPERSHSVLPCRQRLAKLASRQLAAEHARGWRVISPSGYRRLGGGRAGWRQRRGGRGGGHRASRPWGGAPLWGRWRRGPR